MYKPIIISILIILTAFIISPSVLAQDIGTGSGDNPLNTITNRAGYKTVQGDAFIDTFIGKIIAMVLGFVGALFLGLIVFAGFQWMSAGGNEDTVSKARKKIVSSVIGLGIVLFAFIISNAIFTFFYTQSNRNGVPQTPEQNWLGNECDENSDCPASAPICEQIGLWRWCTCTEEACQQMGLHCYTATLTSNYCSECNLDEHCATGEECDGGECVQGGGGSPPPTLPPCPSPYSCNSINTCFNGTIQNNYSCPNSSEVCCEPDI